jgi:hypothetical protein
MLSDRELRDLSGKNSPEEDYDNYRREFSIPTQAKAAPRGFLNSPQAVDNDAAEAANEYQAINPGANRYAYLYGYMTMAYTNLWHKYQQALHATNRHACTCQTPRNGD